MFYSTTDKQAHKMAFSKLPVWRMSSTINATDPRSIVNASFASFELHQQLSIVGRNQLSYGDYLSSLKKRYGNAGQNDVENFSRTALYILNTADFFVSCLASLEKKLQKIGVKPQYTPSGYIVGNGIVAPDLSEGGWSAIPKQHTDDPDDTLNNILLELEHEHGINQDGVPIFIGFVDHNTANNFVLQNHVFREEAQIDRGLWHGIHSHRLQILALLEGFKKLNFKFADKTKLTATKLLQLLIQNDLWQTLIDNVVEADAIAVNEETTQFVFSASSPSMLNSFLLCSEQLPHLRYLLLKEHYYEAHKMIKRVEHAAEQRFQEQYDDYSYHVSSFLHLLPPEEQKTNIDQLLNIYKNSPQYHEPNFKYFIDKLLKLTCPEAPKIEREKLYRTVIAILINKPDPATLRLNTCFVHSATENSEPYYDPAYCGYPNNESTKIALDPRQQTAFEQNYQPSSPKSTCLSRLLFCSFYSDSLPRGQGKSSLSIKQI